MKYPSTFTPFRQGGSTSYATRKPKDATDFLRANDTMASLMPALTRMAALQKNCAAVLPAMFKACDVMQFDTGQLVLSTPNAALATKLKQQLPKLQDQLLKDGWQINAIRIKVHVGKNYVPAVAQKQCFLTDHAVSAFADLSGALEDSPRNQALKNALENMVRRHRDIK